VHRTLGAPLVLVLAIGLLATGWNAGENSGSARSVVTIAAAGDIACDPASELFDEGQGEGLACRQRATSDLLLSGGYDAVLTLGDNQYENGEYASFTDSYRSSWGRVKSITRPASGNHEYMTPAASGYFQYFGRAAGAPAKGYYSFELGRWHLIALNSNCAAIGGCGRGSARR